MRTLLGPLLPFDEDTEGQMLRSITPMLRFVIADAAVLALVSLSSVSVLAQTTYMIKNLGTVCDHPLSEPAPTECYRPYSRAFAVNDAGQAVGISGSEEVGHVTVHAFRTGRGKAIDRVTDLLDMSHWPGSPTARAYSINNYGATVGVATDPGTVEGLDSEYEIPSGVASHSILWGFGAPTRLEAFPPPASDSAAAFAINNAYQFHVAARGVGFDGVHGFVHQFVVFGSFGSNYAHADLGTFPGGTTSEARGVNDQGYAVGFGNTDNGLQRGFIRTTGPLIGLGTLGGGACLSCESRAYAINNANQIVGEADTYLPFLKFGPRHAFLVTPAKDPNFPLLLPVDLGTLAGVACLLCRSAAYDINDIGDIVGESELVDGSAFTHAFLHRDGIIRDLNDLIPVEAKALWVLTDARGISEFGQIVGTGLFEGQMRAYLLTPPVQLLITNAIGVLSAIATRTEGLRESLRVKLQSALDASDSGETMAACYQVTAFENEVSAQSGRGLSAVQATKLVAGARVIKTELTCKP